MKGKIFHDDKSSVYSDFNEYIDDVDRMRGSNFQTQKEKGWKMFMMQVKGQK